MVRKTRPQKIAKFVELHFYFLKVHEQQRVVNKNYFEKRLYEFTNCLFYL